MENHRLDKGADEDQEAEPDPKAQKRAGRHGAYAPRTFPGIVGGVIARLHKVQG